jgi:protein-S-isoprenylcysteine O-methyltransferase Ste14
MESSATAVGPAREPSKQKFRWFSRRGRGRYGTLLLGLGIVLALLGRPRILPGSVADLVLDVIGWLVFLAGATLRTWSMLYIGGRKAKMVLDRGPYALLRHPLYSGSLLIATSMGLFVGSAVMLVATLVTAVAYHFHVIPREEDRLVEKLGEPYEEYCRRTNRYLPRFSKPAGDRVVEVDMNAMGRELTRAVWWMLVPVFAALISWLRVQAWWPHLLPFS